jgi:dsRNA-specific ribonuclease
VEVRIVSPTVDDPDRTVALAEAEGQTKKQAQQSAAHLALKYLTKANPA